MKTRHRLKPILLRNGRPGYVLQGRSLGMWFDMTDRQMNEITFEGDSPTYEAEITLRHLNSSPIETPG